MVTTYRFELSDQGILDSRYLGDLQFRDATKESGRVRQLPAFVCNQLMRVPRNANSRGFRARTLYLGRAADRFSRTGSRAACARRQQVSRLGSFRPVRPVLTAVSKETPSDAPFSIGQLTAKRWRSASPFVPPRHFYRGKTGKRTFKVKDQPEHQLVECLKAVGITTPGEIRRLPAPGRHDADGQSPWEIVRTPDPDECILDETTNVLVDRPGTSAARGKERRVGLFLEIEFDEPVSLPVPALGHSCHFGLGLFVPVIQGAGGPP